MSRHGYVYLTTNKINGKKYIGKKTAPIFVEDYFGSGRAVKHAIKKYGKENFQVEVLAWYDNEDELCAGEIKHIKKSGAADKKNYYNIGSGGEGVAGGRFSEEHKNNLKKAQRKKEGTKCKPCRTYKSRPVVNRDTNFFGVRYDGRRNAFVAFIHIYDESYPRHFKQIQRYFNMNKYSDAKTAAVRAFDAFIDLYYPDAEHRNLNPDGTIHQSLLEARKKQLPIGVTDLRRNNKNSRPFHEERPYEACFAWSVKRVTRKRSGGHFSTPEEAAYVHDLLAIKYAPNLSRIRFNYPQLRDDPTIPLRDLI